MLAGAADDSNTYETTTLYFGNLSPGVTLSSLQDVCAFFGPVEHVKVVRDKTSGTSAGYGFVRFSHHAGAEAALNTLNGKACLGKELRINWAFQAPAKDEAPHQFQVFVGDLAQDVTDSTLFESFREAGCCQARVLWDHATGRSKRYGFVSFRSRAAGDAAIVAMHGQYIGWSRVRCRWAQHKQDESQPPPDVMSVNRADAFNTNVYVGNIPQEWTDADLCNHFSAFGPLVEARLHRRGSYAFVRFEDHHHAVQAIVNMQGANVDGQVLKCSWGKNMPLLSSGPGQEAATVPFYVHPLVAVPSLDYRLGDGMPAQLSYPSCMLPMPAAAEGSGSGMQTGQLQGGQSLAGFGAGVPMSVMTGLLQQLSVQQHQQQQQQQMLYGQLQGQMQGQMQGQLQGQMLQGQMQGQGQMQQGQMPWGDVGVAYGGAGAMMAPHDMGSSSGGSGMFFPYR